MANNTKQFRDRAGLGAPVLCFYPVALHSTASLKALQQLRVQVFP